jgi:hypothetical protein
MPLNSIVDTLKTDLSFFADSSGDIGYLNGLQNLQRALFRRLVTVPGTLVHKPQYGIGVGLFQNAPNSFSIQQKLAALITDQFPQDPRVQSVSSVSITSEDGTPEMTKIVVTLVPVGYTEQPMTFMPFSRGNS